MSNFDEVVSTYQKNKERVESLIQIYKNLGTEKKKGRKSVLHTDILRSSVVFLHASLEEVMRGLAIIIWPTKDAKFINDRVPLWSEKKKDRSDKFYLGELLNFEPDTTIREIIQDSVKQYIDSKFTINNVGQLKKEITDLEIFVNISDSEAQILEGFFQRRHSIVHHADKNNNIGGSGNHSTKTIKPKDVEKYITEVDKVIQALFCEMQKQA
ncbi:HEPN domain-containing protein [Neisseria subflava]|jgi:hypothetical protein|uniref:HEPN domain-containing protein n=1 Tax=Morococcus cerebrosus TaxID=1056807 RepID=A0ABY3YFM9_9NEIS|nr:MULTISPECIES: HEPN domain-containing protein [Neisseriaceae]OHR75075.1 hypothetical protein HMPREF3277_07450 [Neisseria sp. HMSC70E02]QCL71763.1 hypothetical protein FAH66_09965 [Neisseria subflava]UNV88123.1 HEPN domain-containing protein [Morococcus cerebrosus]WMS18636.1 HEPN domain-containing protein [Neisseria subflava]